MAAPKGNNFNPDGRPRKEIKWEEFEELCKIQCTQSEIASVLKVHIDTLRDHVAEHYAEDFSNVYKKYSENGKMSLRRTQIKLAQKNPAMCIWLGKQYLGQKDTIIDNHVNSDLLTRHVELMNQLTALQSERKIADNSNSAEPKS